MKQNEILGHKELESINSEISHSFDPDDASWIIGGRSQTGRFTYYSGTPDGELDVEF